MQTLKEKLEILLAASTQTPPSIEVAFDYGWHQLSVQAALAYGLDDFLIRPLDPYRELKAAHAAGKTIQRINHAVSGEWVDIGHDSVPKYLGVDSEYAPNKLRIKPDEPWSLHEHVAKSFGPLPKDAKFHREDWTADMLPEGWRPLLDGELIQLDDVCLISRELWVSIGRNGNGCGTLKAKSKAGNNSNHLRTRRPYPQPKRRVPLEAKDVPPGSVFRLPGTNAWFTPVSVTNYGVNFVSNMDGARLFRSFDDITDYHEIKRPGEDWQPCSKEISA